MARSSTWPTSGRGFSLPWWTSHSHANNTLTKSKSCARALYGRRLLVEHNLEKKRKMAEQPVFLSDDVVARFLSYDELIPRLEEVLGQFSRGDSSEVVQPVRSVMPIHNHHGYEDDPLTSDLTSNRFLTLMFCKQVFGADACIYCTRGHFVHQDGGLLQKGRKLKFTINSSHCVTL